MFYLVLKSKKVRDALLKYLKEYNICAVFHYISLHKSLYFQSQHDGRELVNSDHYTDCLIRLPFYYELELSDVKFICRMIHDFLLILSK